MSIKIGLLYPSSIRTCLMFCFSFGITPTMEKMHHVGTMRTKMDDCQFVCIAQSEYYRILHQGEENTRKLEENGRVVLVTEHRVLDGGTRRGHVVIRGWYSSNSNCSHLEVSDDF